MGRAWTKEEYDKAKTLKLAGVSINEIASQLRRSNASIGKKLRGIDSPLGSQVTKTTTDDLESIATEQTKDAQTITWTTTTPVRTVDQALAKAEVDTNVWSVKNFIINSWEQAAKLFDPKTNKYHIKKTPLWQVKVWLESRTCYSPKEFLDELMNSYQTKSPKKPKKIKPCKSGILTEISIMDHHFGKLAWEPECGQDYDTNIARDRYNKASSYLIQDSVIFSPEKFLVVLGNDFYHVDKGNNTTTSGTQVDTDGRWQKAFLIGLQCVQQTINEALEIAPVDVICVPGNHDTERLFTLGVCLQGIYQNNPNVVIHNQPTIKKAFLWGKTLLAFYHGHRMNKSKLERLPQDMAHIWPSWWSESTWREWHLGHIHSEHEDVWRYRRSESIGDCIVRRLPSLNGTDRWHFEEGYYALPAAESHQFSKSYGRLGYRSVPLSLLQTL